MTMRESRPAMSTPTVVTVRTVHLYLIRIAFRRPAEARSPRGPGGRATKRRRYLNLPNHRRREHNPQGASGDTDALDRMMAGDQIPRHPEVPSFLSDRATFLRGLHRHGRVNDVPALLDLHAFHVEVPEDVRDEPVGLVGVLDHVDVLVHEPFQLRDVLALLPDRLADVPFLHDENQLVAGVDAVDDRRPREILEESHVFDRLFVKDNLDHAASGAEDVRVAGAEDGDGRDGERHPAGSPQIDVRAGEMQQTDLAEGRDRVRRAVRRDDDDLRALRLRGPADFSKSEAHLAGVRRDTEGAGNVNHGTTSSMGSSGSAGSAAGAGRGVGRGAGRGAGTGTGTGGTGTGFGFGIAEGFGRPAGGW